MMMFFETTQGASIPVSRIARIEAHKSQLHHTNRATSFEDGVRVILVDGSGVRISRFEARRLLDQRAMKVWPALPRTSTVNVDPETGSIWKQPVIGWALNCEGVVAPITQDGVNDGMEDVQAVETPDGSVTVPGCQAWNSVDDYVASQMRDAASTEAQP